MTQTSHHPHSWAGVGYAFGAAVAAGIMVPVGKLAGAPLNPTSFLAWMALIASLAGFATMWLRGESVRWRRLDWRTMLYHGVAVTLALSCLWEGVSRIHPAAAAFIGNSQVLFSILIGRALFGERLTKASMAAAVLILVGLIMMQWDAKLSDAGDVVGCLYVLAAALFFALADSAMKRRADTIVMFPFLAARNLILAGVFFIGANLGPGFAVPVSGVNWLQVVVASIVGLLISRLCFNLALRELAISRATLLFQIYPLVAMLVTVALGGGWPRAMQLAGGLILTVGVMALALLKERGLRGAVVQV